MLATLSEAISNTTPDIASSSITEASVVLSSVGRSEIDKRASGRAMYVCCLSIDAASAPNCASAAACVIPGFKRPTTIRQ